MLGDVARALEPCGITTRTSPSPSALERLEEARANQATRATTSQDHHSAERPASRAPARAPGRRRPAGRAVTRSASASQPAAVAVGGGDGRPAAVRGVAGRRRGARRAPCARASRSSGVRPPGNRRRSGAHSAGFRRMRGQIALQQMRGGPRVGVLAAPGALGEPRGEALVVELHRNVQSPLEPFAQTPGPRAACSPSSPRERQRKPHHHPLGPVLLDQRRERRRGRAWCRGAPPTGSGVASVPDGSEIAQPQRAEP